MLLLPTKPTLNTDCLLQIIDTFAEDQDYATLARFLSVSKAMFNLIAPKIYGSLFDSCRQPLHNGFQDWSELRKRKLATLLLTSSGFLPTPPSSSPSPTSVQGTKTDITDPRFNDKDFESWEPVFTLPLSTSYVSCLNHIPFQLYQHLANCTLNNAFVYNNCNNDHLLINRSILYHAKLLRSVTLKNTEHLETLLSKVKELSQLVQIQVGFKTTNLFSQQDFEGLKLMVTELIHCFPHNATRLDVLGLEHNVTWQNQLHCLLGPTKLAIKAPIGMVDSTLGANLEVVLMSNNNTNSSSSNRLRNLTWLDIRGDILPTTFDFGGLIQQCRKLQVLTLDLEHCFVEDWSLIFGWAVQERQDQETAKKREEAKYRQQLMDHHHQPYHHNQHPHHHQQQQQSSVSTIAGQRSSSLYSLPISSSSSSLVPIRKLTLTGVCEEAILAAMSAFRDTLQEISIASVPVPADHDQDAQLFDGGGGDHQSHDIGNTHVSHATASFVTAQLPRYLSWDWSLPKLIHFKAQACTLDFNSLRFLPELLHLDLASVSNHDSDPSVLWIVPTTVESLSVRFGTTYSRLDHSCLRNLKALRSLDFHEGYNYQARTRIQEYDFGAKEWKGCLESLQEIALSHGAYKDWKMATVLHLAPNLRRFVFSNVMVDLKDLVISMNEDEKENEQGQDIEKKTVLALGESTTEIEKRQESMDDIVSTLSVSENKPQTIVVGNSTCISASSIVTNTAESSSTVALPSTTKRKDLSIVALARNSKLESLEFRHSRLESTTCRQLVQLLGIKKTSASEDNNTNDQYEFFPRLRTLYFSGLEMSEESQGGISLARIAARPLMEQIYLDNYLSPSFESQWLESIPSFQLRYKPFSGELNFNGQHGYQNSKQPVARRPLIPKGVCLMSARGLKEVHYKIKKHWESKIVGVTKSNQEQGEQTEQSIEQPQQPPQPQPRQQSQRPLQSGGFFFFLDNAYRNE